MLTSCWRQKVSPLSSSTGHFACPWATTVGTWPLPQILDSVHPMPWILSAKVICHDDFQEPADPPSFIHWRWATGTPAICMGLPRVQAHDGYTQ